MSTKALNPITLPSRPVLLAVALALLGIASALGPIDTLHPAVMLEGAILYIIIGALFVLAQFAPTQLRTMNAGRLISGSALLSLGLFFLGQGGQILNTNVFVAGAYFLAGGVLILLGTLFPTGFLHKALSDFNEAN